MNRSRIGWVMVLSMATLVGSEALAQRQGPGQGGRGFGGFGGGARRGLTSLLTVEAVQKELGLSSEAVEKVKAIGESLRQDMTTEMANLGGGNFREQTAEQRRETMAKMEELRRTVQSKYLPKIKEILTAEQFTRLQQIEWQAAGTAALADPELAGALGLTGDQKERLATITREFAQKQRELMGEAFRAGGGGGGNREAFAKVQELAKERDSQALGVLNSDQQAQFASLKGPSFDVAQLRPQGGRGDGASGDGQRPRRGAGRPNSQNDN